MVVRWKAGKHIVEVVEKCSGLALPQTSCGILEKFTLAKVLPFLIWTIAC